MAAKIKFGELENRLALTDNLMQVGLQQNLDSPLTGIDFDPLRRVDYSYFHGKLPHRICHDAALQNQICQLWEKVVSKVDRSREKTVAISLPHGLIKVFQIFLKSHHRVKSTFSFSDQLVILLKEEPPSLSANKIGDSIAYYSSLESKGSRCIQFVNTHLPSDTPDYMEKLVEISKKARSALLKEQPHVFIPAMGYDRLFLKNLLRQLYPLEIRTIVPEPAQLKGGLYIAFKKGIVFSETSMQNREKLKIPRPDPKEFPELAHFPSSFLNTPSSSSRHSPLRSHSVPSVPPSSNLQDEMFKGGVLLVSGFLASYIQNSPGKEIPKLDDFDKWYSLFKRLDKDPILLRTLGAEIQQFLFEQKETFSIEQIQSLRPLCSCSDLKTASSFLLKHQDDPLWLQLDRQLKTLPYLRQIKEMDELYKYHGGLRKAIQELTILKCQIEMATFHPKEDFSIDLLKQIPIDQVYRTCLPSGSEIPLVSIIINSHPISIDSLDFPPEVLRFIYYDRLITTLYYVATGQKIDAVPILQEIMKDQEIVDERFPHLFLVLKISSFSAWGHVDSALRKKILPALLQSYEIKIQAEPTCEFFIARNGDFTMIRTSVYKIKIKKNKAEKGEVEKGEIVVKWTASLSSGIWSFGIKIPSINLNTACSIEEQRKIYSGFKLPAKKEEPKPFFPFG